jgi:dihydroxyacetone kinase-like predicted kinase
VRPEELRERLAAIGDSVVVVGGGELHQAHVHTDDPELAVEEGIRTGGRLAQVRIVSLDERVAGGG